MSLDSQSITMAILREIKYLPYGYALYIRCAFNGTYWYSPALEYKSRADYLIGKLDQSTEVTC